VSEGGTYSLNSSELTKSSSIYASSSPLSKTAVTRGAFAFSKAALAHKAWAEVTFLQASREGRSLLQVREKCSA
jgi:hypothetical protein